MKKYGQDIDSKVSWNQMAKAYSDELSNNYHSHRLEVIDALIPEELYQYGKQIFDFGCGDAVHFDKFLQAGANINGVDISQEIITIAKNRLINVNSNPNLIKVGDVYGLAELKDNSLDGIISFNVLAYLTNEEEQFFYKQAYRLLKPGGHLIVTHSNELFDMYSLNQHTANFFNQLVIDKKLLPDVQSLICNDVNNESMITYNIRENPLSYKFKLLNYGFAEQTQEFINLHVAPPKLLHEDKFYPNTLSWKEEDRWKLMFICSTFGSKSVRKESNDV